MSRRRRGPSAPGWAEPVGRGLGCLARPGVLDGHLVGPWEDMNTLTPEPDPAHGPPPVPPALKPFSVEPLDVERLVATGLLDAVPGHPPVPITAWRLTDLGPAAGGEDGSGPVSAHARLAQLLLATFTLRGQLVVDLAGDVVLAGVAGAGARRYHHLPPGRRRTAVHLHGAAQLVYADWPPTTGPHACPGPGSATMAPDGDDSRPEPGPQAGDLLRLCSNLLTRRGTTVIAVRPQADVAYMDQAALLIPAAHAAGLGYLQHLLAITTPTTTASATGSRDGDVHRDAHVPLTFSGLDLLVFVLKRGITR